MIVFLRSDGGRAKALNNGIICIMVVTRNCPGFDIDFAARMYRGCGW